MYSLSRTQIIAAALGLLLVVGLISVIFWNGFQIREAAEKVRHKEASKQVQVVSSQGESKASPEPGLSARESPLTVKTGENGRLQAVLPETIAKSQQSEIVARPEVQVPTAREKPAFVESSRGGGQEQWKSPPVPNALIDQTPPESAAGSGSTSAMTQIHLASRRYLFNNMASGALAGESVRFKPEEQADFNPETFSPSGEDISLALMDNVTSNSFEVPVAAAVWQPFYFQGHRLLNTGDKLQGNASPGKSRDRLIVNFNRIIFKDGRSLPMKALALAPDGTVGIKGFIVGENLLKTLTPVLLEAVKGFASSFENSTVTTSNSLLGTTTQQTLGNDLGTKGIEAGRGALEKISQIIAQDLEENRPYLLAVAGTPFKARLQQPLDFSLADYGK